MTYYCLTIYSKAGIRGASRTAATFKMERFVIIVNRFQPLTIITKCSILDVAAFLDPPLSIVLLQYISKLCTGRKVKITGIIWLSDFRDESHISFRMHCVILTQRTRPHASPLLSASLPFNVDSSKFLNIFRIKKANSIFEELSILYLIVLISYFLLLLCITAENGTKLKKLFIWTTTSGGKRHHKHTNRIFISNCNNVSYIFDWLEFIQFPIPNSKGFFELGSLSCRC